MLEITQHGHLTDAKMQLEIASLKAASSSDSGISAVGDYRYRPTANNYSVCKCFLGKVTLTIKVV